MGLTRDGHEVSTRGASPELDYNPHKKPLGNAQLGPSTLGQKAQNAEATGRWQAWWLTPLGGWTKGPSPRGTLFPKISKGIGLRG
jgi:hypothetical protein